VSETSYNVQIWNTEGRKNAAGKITSYRVRWRVENQDHRQAFKTSAHAESFRSELLTAARKGEAFLIESPGLPIAMVRRNKDTRSWFDFACDYVDMKWPHTSPGQRKSTADSLIAITNALWTSQAGQPDQRVVNRALRTAYSSTARDSDHPAEIQRALRWISRHTRQTGELAKPDLLRALLAALDRNQSGERAAPDTVRLRRTTLRNALDYAVEKKLLDKNPMSEVKVKRQTTTLKQVDQRAVVNPTQARALLRAIRARNPRLEAFFGLLYYAALRPEEATNFRQRDMVLAADGWGELHLSKATPRGWRSVDRHRGQE
jgi:nitroreductase